MLNNRRLLNFIGFAACAALMGYALYAQHVLNLDPCPLCIFQRVGVIAMGIVFLIAAIHHPRGWGSYVYAGLTTLTALVTIGVSARHLYVQSLPEGAVPACGAPLNVLLKFTPLMEVIKRVLIGGGECQQVNWTFLGLAMPAWVLICAVLLGALGLYANLRRRSAAPLSVQASFGAR